MLLHDNKVFMMNKLQKLSNDISYLKNIYYIFREFVLKKKITI